MGTTLSEPCIYDKLSESIDILRQSGYRYGMSEREIEKFIKQVLETNEPRREPAQFPVLRASIKVITVVCLLLLMALMFAYTQCLPTSGSVGAAEQYNWSSPLSHIRLLSLPIAKKYNLHSFHAWWSMSHTLLNCSGCSTVSAVFEVSTLINNESVHKHTRPVLVKGGESLCLRRQQLEALHSSHFGCLSVLMEEKEELMSEVFPQGPANFSLLWRVDPESRDNVFHSLFPSALLCPLTQSVGRTVQRCRVTHSTSSQSRGECVLGWLLVGEGFPTVRVLPHQHCQTHCSSFNLWLEPGDLVYADPYFWQLELFPGRGENVVCVGSAVSDSSTTPSALHCV
ncbi:bombesin receptor-activated protein C6orf89 homolog [Tachysurus fulvidraco]|uniref:bombesin receptor-activated protein C6orf89 homolog n=1 Tax=Tachysurus fulvidraco TaxID=1234273 RepID=UPI000F4DF872|nr:bombesin receptor-activated protein C6orf89 homolog [Tachysurus fulvidraco]XP_047664829.1 bombesin receptor-activated protein C6orf89 homolog [Tachysurus fulvidraco]XP_047664834.1 bombesin receptor-activated protein C6orf89 homolog [Tachysurus fulvidraco]XP_047664842.1 bombesin receptor-activated protein C6orf89 homolog [Tachysurus fulvidraco]XP_047666240.1 bombesin receptor-activated protein C6orf89 homolog [Tachysurus fulvidraco]XP_047666241.1 bombesin receptor-activated protein C6orf89 h